MSQLLMFAANLLPLALVLAAALAAARLAPALATRASDWASGRAAPWIVGGITVLVFWFIWGSLAPIPTIHDENAYLLQARLLAAGQLTGPGRPLPEFFEQFHVFVTPLLAAKYPLGFSLALVPGIWLGAPALMPLLLNGLAGGLLFALARRLTSPAIAVLAWLTWLLAPGTITYHASYLSETLSGPLWLMACWALLEWRQTARRGWLVLLALAIGGCAITRPLTAVGLAIPFAVVVTALVWRSRRWADLAIASLAGILVLLPMFYQNAKVTGSWRVTPWERYADIYAPVDRPGFTIDGRPPQRELPADMRAYVVYFTEAHVGFIPRRLPVIFLARLGQVLRDAWGPWLPALAFFALIGMWQAGREVWFGLASLLSLMAVHLIFAHPLNWSLYYQECQPALSLVVALGIAASADFLIRRMGAEPASRTPLALWMVTLCAVGTAASVIPAAREKKAKETAYHQSFHDLVAALPGRSIVFVRYSPIHRFYTSLVDNPPDLESAPSWIVHDLEGENVRLIRLAPDRKAYLYVEQKKVMVPLAPDGSAESTPASAR